MCTTKTNDTTRSIETKSGQLDKMVMPGQKWRWPMYSVFNKPNPRYHTRIITAVEYIDWMDARGILTAFWENPLPGWIRRTYLPVWMIAKGKQIFFRKMLSG